jgi:mannitol/fructose-specific phosphotransferase system IIA component (Ntr-type)
MARLLRHDEVRAKLMEAKTAEEFISVFGEDPEAV